MLEAIGWIGGVLLAICGLPQAYRTYKCGRSDLSSLFIWMWFLGELLTFIYILPFGSYALYLNYSVNLIATSVILFYHIRTG